MAGRTSAEARKARRDARDERQTRVVNLNTGDVQRVDRGKLKTVKNGRVELAMKRAPERQMVRNSNSGGSTQEIQRLKTPSTTAQRLKNATTGPKNRLEMEIKSRNTRKILQDAFRKNKR